MIGRVHGCTENKEGLIMKTFFERASENVFVNVNAKMEWGKRTKLESLGLACSSFGNPTCFADSSQRSACRGI